MRGACIVAMFLGSLMMGSAWAAQGGAVGLNPASASGARQAVLHYESRLVVPPFEAEPRARATCARYLDTALRTLDREGGAPCALQLKALRAKAMCLWLSESVGRGCLERTCRVLVSLSV